VVGFQDFSGGPCSLTFARISRAAVGMGIPVGIPMGIGMGWVWGMIFHPHRPVGILGGFLINLK